MKFLPLLVVALATAGAGCDRSPQAPPATTPVAATQPEIETPTPGASARADALLEDMRKRERDFAQVMRNAPPEPSPDELLRRLQQAAPTQSAVYTPAVAAQPATPAVTAPAAAPPVPSTNFSRVPERDETWWRDRMRTLLTTLDQDRLQLDAAERSMSDSVLQLTYDQAVAERNRLRARVAADIAAIESLELEARRAGIPPGWLRQ